MVAPTQATETKHGPPERRILPLTEFRVEDGEDGRKIIGHAAVWDSLSEELWGWHERVARGAFVKTIQNDDVRALFNHDVNYVLGRNKSGTLSMREDDRGLAVEIDPPDTAVANSVLESIRRGDVSQMSIGFEAITEEWDQSDKDNPLRTLTEVKLWDVSPVTYPAFVDTDVAVRTLDAWRVEHAEPPVRRKVQRRHKKIKAQQAVADLTRQIARGTLQVK